MKRMISIAFSVMCAFTAVAVAEPKTADEWYKLGEDQYNLGNFDDAVKAFKRGFELEPNESKKAAYLFNIAQSYRQANNCKDAVFFYKRYLAFKDADTAKPLKPELRKEIEDRIKELDECARQQEAIRNKPPDRNEKPDGTGETGTGTNTTKPDDKQVGDTTPPDDGGDDGDDGGVTATATGQPKTISLRATGGAAMLSVGDGLDIPVQATVALIGGYPLALNEKLTLDLGAAFSFTPVPFDDMAGQGKTANLIRLLANVGATYEVAPKFGLRGDLGVGMLVFSGVSESPFTSFAPTSGSLSMLHVRVGVSADYAITPNVVATLTPIAFSYSPAKEGLSTVMGGEISAITALDIMVGIGYRM